MTETIGLHGTIRMHGSARVRSEALVLAVIDEERSTTRSRIQERTGLSRSTVAEIVSELLERSLVVESAPVSDHSRGRRPTALSRPSDAGAALGVDIGRDGVRVAVVGRGGEIVAERRTDVDAQEPNLVATAIVALARTVMASAAVTRGSLAGVGVSVPVPIGGGIVPAHTSLPRWAGFDLARRLGRELGVPAACDNDATNAARAEQEWGVGRGVSDFVYIKASSGVGAGLVLGGAVYRGGAGFAGEIGHTQVAGHTELCRCGNRGCLESAVSSTHVGARLREHGIAWPPPVGRRERDVYLAHPVVARVLADAGRSIGEVAAVLCNALQPSLFVLGGYLSELGSATVEGVEESLRRNAAPVLMARVGIRLSALHGDASLLGAAALAQANRAHASALA